MKLSTNLLCQRKSSHSLLYLFAAEICVSLARKPASDKGNEMVFEVDHN